MQDRISIETQEALNKLAESADYPITEKLSGTGDLEQVLKEAYENPELLKHAPHNCAIHHVDHDYLDDPKRWAMTWQAYEKKYKGYFEPR